MSEAVTALEGASSSGIINVADAGLIGMITFRGDLSDDAVRNGIRSSGLPLPGVGEAAGGHEKGVLWMSPDELLILCAYEAVEAQISALTKQLDDQHSLVVNVSDARTLLRLTGDGKVIREVLAKLSPADLRPEVLKAGQVRRTRLAQVPAAVWFTSENEVLVMSFRSVAGYVFGLLSKASEKGSEVGHF